MCCSAGTATGRLVKKSKEMRKSQGEISVRTAVLDTELSTVGVWGAEVDSVDGAIPQQGGLIMHLNNDEFINRGGIQLHIKP
jgi:hypothetical protein